MKSTRSPYEVAQEAQAAWTARGEKKAEEGAVCKYIVEALVREGLIGRMDVTIEFAAQEGDVLCRMDTEANTSVVSEPLRFGKYMLVRLP